MDKSKILIVGGSSTIAERVQKIIAEKLTECAVILSEVEPMPEPKPFVISDFNKTIDFFKPPVSRKERRKRERELKNRQ